LHYADLAEKLIHQQTDMKKHNVAVIYQAKSIALMDKGDNSGSMRYIDKAIEVYPDKENEIMIIGFLVYKSRLLSQEGNIKEALNLGEQVQAKIDKLLPHENYFSSAPFTMKAVAFYHDGVFNKAQPNIEKSIELLISLTKTKGNRRLAYAYKLSGDIAYKQNQKAKAIEAYLKAEKIYQSSLKYQKIREVSDLYVNLVKTYFDMQQHFLAAEYRNKHQDLFGVEDENTLEINLYINQKNQ